MNIRDYKNIYMIGIGGISMSGIAEILVNWGFKVSGSDMSESAMTEKLRSNGINVNIGQVKENITKDIDLVVYTAAIKSDNPELVEARNLGIETVERGKFLGEITKLFKDVIGVAGTHGKTTTSSMVSSAFMSANLDPSIQIGANLRCIDGNYRVGNSDYFIIEACEYCESYLNFKQRSAIVTNIDNDHLDYFKTFENIKKAFVKYVKLIPKDGLLVTNADDKNCLDLRNETSANVITYGILNKEADFTASNIAYNEEGFPCFDVYYHGNFYGHIALSVPGDHNVLNALATIALCDFYGISKEAITKALLNFTGAHRRFEYVGNVQGASIYDDYGHHPTEILATAEALQHKKYHESWVVFQPHTYSRTKNLMKDFAKSLLHFDHILITDIYAARESNTYGVTSEDLVACIQSFGKEALYFSDFDAIVAYLKQHVHSQDIILTQGAGTVTHIGPMLLGEF